MRKENAIQYYPPHKRMEMREYLSRSSIKFKQRPMMNERDIICKYIRNNKLLDFKDQSMYQSPMSDLNESKINAHLLVSPVPNNNRSKCPKIINIQDTSM